MEIKINNKIYETREGEKIYDVCKRNGIKIPTLCSTSKHQGGLCRICLVEINLTDKLVPSCAFPVCEKLEVTTESEKIQKARRINMELLWSDHAGKCAKCRKNRVCELQSLAEEYKIENFHFVPRKEDLTDEEELDLLKDNRIRVVVEDKNPVINRTTEYCVECRRCINICPDKAFGFNHRAGDTVVGTPYKKVLDCSFCGECVRVCPTAALTDQNNFENIIKELDDLNKMAIALVDKGMEEKVIGELSKLGNQKKFDEIMTMLGFEKIMSVSEEDSEDREIRNIKTDYARAEKIDPRSMVIFFISDKIAKKASKNEYLDYILTEREIARLVRDKKII